MTPVFLLGVLGACLGLTMACLGIAFSSAPGWREQRAFYVLALACGAYCACDVVATTEVSLVWRVWCLRISLAAVAVAVAGWLGLARAHFATSSLTRMASKLIPVNLLLGALTLIPGLATTETVRTRHIPWLRLTYHDVLPTAFGEAALAVYGLSLVLLCVQMIRTTRSGAPEGKLYGFWVFTMLGAFAVDSLSYVGVLDWPYLASAAFLMVMVSMGVLTVRRFIASAKALEALSAQLEQRVEERTRELADATAALARSERLAALGRLTGGIAHEINNPAAAVKANLSYLLSFIHDGNLPEDTAQCLDDSLEGIERVESIVRQLLDTGKLTSRELKTGEVTDVARAANEAAEAARPVVPPVARLSVDVPDGLWTRGSPVVLQQILSHLIMNSSQAIVAGTGVGSINVRAQADGEDVLLEVIDDGCGMDEHTQERMFEPFFSTRPLGQGKGLGLSVTAGLISTLGGTLSVESRLGQGTSMRLRLPAVPLRAAERRAV